MNKKNLMHKYKLEEDELKTVVDKMKNEANNIENKKLREAIFELIDSGDVGISELELKENDNKFLIGDVVNISVDSPDCSFPICGVYKGVIIEHHEVGLCIAIHDMSVIEVNIGKVYYPQFIGLSTWYNYEIELVYREKDNWMETKRLQKEGKEIVTCSCQEEDKFLLSNLK